MNNRTYQLKTIRSSFVNDGQNIAFACRNRLMLLLQLLLSQFNFHQVRSRHKDRCVYSLAQRARERISIFLGSTLSFPWVNLLSPPIAYIRNYPRGYIKLFLYGLIQCFPLSGKRNKITSVALSNFGSVQTKDLCTMMNASKFPIVKSFHSQEVWKNWLASSLWYHSTYSISDFFSLSFPLHYRTVFPNWHLRNLSFLFSLS